MKILYKNKKLEKVCSSLKEMKKKFDINVAEKLNNTLVFIDSANDMNDLYLKPSFNLHPLKGDREGQFSIYIGKTFGYRIIFVPLDEKEKELKNIDILEYKKIKIIKIEGVSNHYA